MTRMRCAVCLEGDDARKGDVNRYKAVNNPDTDESCLLGGDYHLMCALSVGYNEWDEEN